MDAHLLPKRPPTHVAQLLVRRSACRSQVDVQEQQRSQLQPLSALVRVYPASHPQQSQQLKKLQPHPRPPVVHEQVAISVVQDAHGELHDKSGGVQAQALTGMANQASSVTEYTAKSSDSAYRGARRRENAVVAAAGPPITREPIAAYNATSRESE